MWTLNRLTSTLTTAKMEQPDSSPQYNAQYIDNDSDSENIVLKPSVELIPDEYEHVDNKAALVHIFRGEYKHDLINCERFRGSLVKIGYEVPDENVHFIRTKEQVQRDLEKSEWRTGVGCYWLGCSCR